MIVYSHVCFSTLLSSSSGSWPPSLQKFVERALAANKTERDSKFTEKYLKTLILKANQNGTLYTQDWSQVPLPNIPSNWENNNFAKKMVTPSPYSNLSHNTPPKSTTSS